MRKVAIFVEGQTELILVRDFLLKKFGWVVNIQCLEIYKGGNFRGVPYPYNSQNAEIYFQIVKVGNDMKVLSAILEREKGLLEAGFEKVIGLRDMYSREYRDISSEINNELNDEFIKEAFEQINKRATSPRQIAFCYSIMEVEAWFLGMTDGITKFNETLTCEFIKDKCSIDLENINPETEYFHPSVVLSNIFEHAGIRYDKKSGDVEAICSVLTIEDFEKLYASNKCKSFANFYNQVLA